MSWLKNYEQKKAEKAYQKDLTQWQQQCDNIQACLQLAQTFNGEQTDELMLKPNELLYYQVSGTGLIEQRLGPGQWQGRSSGVSVPIGHIGHSSIRYHVGSTKGTYVQGIPHDAVVDTGTTYITNQRLVFEGAKQTRECSFTKLLGVHHEPQSGETTLSVSNRQKPTTILYGTTVQSAFVFRLSLALAHYKNSVPQLIKQLEDTLVQQQQNQPRNPNI